MKNGQRLITGRFPLHQTEGQTLGFSSKPNDELIIGRKSQVYTSHQLDASLFARSAAVVWNWSAIFNRLNIQAGGLKCSNRTFSTTSWAFDSNVNFFDAEFHRLVSCLLSSTLSGERSTFSAAFETACPGTGPTKSLAFGVSDGNGGVVKSRLNVSNTVSHITTHSTFFGFCHCLLSPLSCCAVGRFDFKICFEFLCRSVRRSPVTQTTKRLLEILNTLFACHGFFRSFSSSCVRLGSLTTHRQANSMANTPVASNVSQSTNVLLNQTTKRTFNGVISLKNCRDSTDFFIRQITCTFVRIHACLVTQVTSSLIAYTIQIGKRDDSFSVIRNVNTQQTWHTIFSKGLVSGQLLICFI